MEEALFGFHSYRSTSRFIISCFQIALTPIIETAIQYLFNEKGSLISLK